MLESGQTWTASITLVADRHSPARLETNAVVSAYTRDPDLADNRATGVIALAPFHPTPGVDLVASLQPAQRAESFSIPPPAVPNADYELSFRIPNRGAEDARQTHVVATFSRDVTFGDLGLSTEDYSCGPEVAPRKVDCVVSTIESGSRLNGAVFVHLETAGPLTVTLTVTPAQADTKPSDNTASQTFDVKLSR